MPIINWGILLGISYYLHGHKLYLDGNGLAMSEFQYDFSLVVTLSVFVFLLLLQVGAKNKAIVTVVTFLGKHSFSAYLLQTNPLVFTFLITNNYLFLQKQTPLVMILDLIMIAGFWYFGAIFLDVFRLLLFRLFNLRGKNA